MGGACKNRGIWPTGHAPYLKLYPHLQKIPPRECRLPAASCQAGRPSNQQQIEFAILARLGSGNTSAPYPGDRSDWQDRLADWQTGRTDWQTGRLAGLAGQPGKLKQEWSVSRGQASRMRHATAPPLRPAACYKAVQCSSMLGTVQHHATHSAAYSVHCSMRRPALGKGYVSAAGGGEPSVANQILE